MLSYSVTGWEFKEFSREHKIVTGNIPHPNVEPIVTHQNGIFIVHELLAVEILNYSLFAYCLILLYESTGFNYLLGSDLFCWLFVSADKTSFGN